MTEPVLPADTECLACGERFVMNGPLHVCHVVPLIAEWGWDWGKDLQQSDGSEGADGR